jgi:hypothetical protein
METMHSVEKAARAMAVAAVPEVMIAPRVEPAGAVVMALMAWFILNGN